MEGKCFLWASFLSRPQNTCTIPRVAAVTGSEKSPPGGDTLKQSNHGLLHCLKFKYRNQKAKKKSFEDFIFKLPKDE